MSVEASAHFQKLVDAGHPVGEIISLNNFLVGLSGLQPVTLHSVVIFTDGSKGFVRDILEDRVMVLRLGTGALKIGSLAVVAEDDLTAKVGKDFIGRVISVLGEPLDGKGAIAADASWPVFNAAPPIYLRELLNTQLETGVSIIDTLFPIVRGQRLDLLSPSRAKRRSDVDTLLARLSDSGVMSKSIVVVSTIFESLVNSYLAPYVGCALAEYLWQKLSQDVVVIYDDLSAHAQAYREISLLLGTSPGRDSYPGDIFHSHSSLLERAGKLKPSRRCLTAIPIVLTEGGDISTYLPTNVMSITDGQWILDNKVFRLGRRPAINTGLSVTRVGGVGQNARQKAQNGAVFKLLSQYQKAQEFARFGAEMAAASQQVLLRGRQLDEFFSQIPGETYSTLVQQMLLDIILMSETATDLDIASLKKAATLAAAAVKTEADYDVQLQQLKNSVLAPAPAVSGGT